MSILLRKRIIEVLVNHRELATDSKSVMASCIRLTVSSSYSFWSSARREAGKSAMSLNTSQEDPTFADSD